MTEKELDQLIGERDYRSFLNAKNELYRERKMGENPPPRKEAIRMMAEHPNLIKRPLLVRGKEIIFGFKPEEWDGLK